MSSARREKGFTLLEIMIALALLAVGAVCVLSTFAAAIALHLRREGDVRAARVLEEAGRVAQDDWDTWNATKRQPFPPPRKEQAYSRDDMVSFAITYESAPGQPKGLDELPAGALAVVKIITAGDQTRVREERLFLVRSGPRPGELKSSLTFENEKKEEKSKPKTNNPYGSGRKDE